MKIFISGGCKNGKSYLAQRLAKSQQNNELYYIATMKPSDCEDKERILRHLADRGGWGFKTVEIPAGISKILDVCDVKGSFLLDSVTALLANEMFCHGDIVSGFSYKNIIDDFGAIYSCINDIVVVSDYIYSDANIYSETTESYRRALAEIDRFAAFKSDIVIECVYSNLVFHKGLELFKSLMCKKGIWPCSC